MQHRMSRAFRLVSALLALCLILTACAPQQLAPEPTPTPTPTPVPTATPTPTPIPTPVEMSYEEYFSEERDYRAIGSPIYFEVDLDGSLHDCENGAGHLLRYENYDAWENRINPTCILKDQLAGETRVNQIGLLCASEDHKQLFYLAHDGSNKCTLFDTGETIQNFFCDDYIAYVKVPQTVYRIFLATGQIDKVFTNWKYLSCGSYDFIFDVPWSNTDFKWSQRTDTPPIPDWQGSGDGYEYNCYMYSCLTNKSYEISPFPLMFDEEAYWAEREADLTEGHIPTLYVPPTPTPTLTPTPTQEG